MLDTVMPRMHRILVIEDEHDIAQLLSIHLSENGNEVAIESNGLMGLRRALETAWDLIVLDLHLPDIDGLEICRHIRARGHYIPILMLTSRTTELDRVLGLEIGADDYVTKPFSIVELQARVKALLRRVDALSVQLSTRDSVEESVSINDLELNREQRKIYKSGRDIELTAKEFDLLWFFASHPGRVFKRLELLEEVWGYGHDGYEHTVNSHINRLRAKIESDPSKPQYIQTVWGVGYRFDDDSMNTAGLS